MKCTTINAMRKSLFSSNTIRKSFFSSDEGAKTIKLSWLDLRGSGLSIIERLCLEEALLRHDPKDRNWAIVGTHEPLRHRFIEVPRTKFLPDYMLKAEDGPNPTCMVVMGIGGKPHELLNMDLVKQDGVAVIKRFSGGGTVVLDPSSIWTTFIGRTNDFPHVEPYPRSIMKWSADSVFGPAFLQLQQQQQLENQPASKTYNNKNRGQKTLVPDGKSCGSSEVTGDMVRVPAASSVNDGSNPPALPSFKLRENDYVLGERKIGGNAQTIVKGSWLHHTSFLWDYHVDNMAYLTLPHKRPDYRGDRSHDDFLVKLNEYFGNSGSNRPFFTAVKTACGKEFELEDVTLNEAMEIVHDLGGMDAWFAKSRTRILNDF